jgi:hypothetical protein
MKITSTTGYSTQQNYHSKYGAIKTFHDKQKLKQYVTTKPPLQKILQGILHTKVKPNITMKGQHQTIGKEKERK